GTGRCPYGSLLLLRLLLHQPRRVAFLVSHRYRLAAVLADRYFVADVMNHELAHLLRDHIQYFLSLRILHYVLDLMNLKTIAHQNAVVGPNAYVHLIAVDGADAAFYLTRLNCHFRNFLVQPGDDLSHCVGSGLAYDGLLEIGAVHA